jgi:hypothetical protein
LKVGEFTLREGGEWEKEQSKGKRAGESEGEKEREVRTCFEIESGERERRRMGINRVEDMERERQPNGKMVVVRTRQAYVSAHSAQMALGR